MKLTEPQYLALKKYEDERAYNETALGVRANVYDRLVKMGYLKRSYFLNSRITTEGCAALKAFEDRKK
ncbi:hypothetical protein F406_gp030 [Agrobacterium phage 7-7-1]|uniref:Uncharacterized protein n=1 Tax=Agrobacterium phage 7-7-1 TaxID=1161931 RepID=J7F8Z0_9CAUD|nr:hypothetical protein F406_gp030 [Agrobacterium phage 7-7-1]AFH19785.1 hypothetical protein 7-7-1_00087 [Agrobacterium phage 7-7-1]